MSIKQSVAAAVAAGSVSGSIDAATTMTADSSGVPNTNHAAPTASSSTSTSLAHPPPTSSAAPTPSNRRRGRSNHSHAYDEQAKRMAAAATNAASPGTAAAAASITSPSSWSNQLYSSHTYSPPAHLAHSPYELYEDRSTFHRYLNEYFRGLTDIDLIKLGVWNACAAERLQQGTKMRQMQMSQANSSAQSNASTSRDVQSDKSALASIPSPLIFDATTDAAFVIPPLGIRSAPIITVKEEKSAEEERNFSTPIPHERQTSTSTTPTPMQQQQHQDEADRIDSDIHMPSIHDEPSLQLQLGALPLRTDVDQMQQFVESHSARTSAPSSVTPHTTSVLVMFTNPTAASSSSSSASSASSRVIYPATSSASTATNVGSTLDPSNDTTMMIADAQNVVCQFHLTTAAVSTPPFTTVTSTSATPPPTGGEFSFHLSALQPTHALPQLASFAPVWNEISSLASAREDALAATRLRMKRDADEKQKREEAAEIQRMIDAEYAAAHPHHHHRDHHKKSSHHHGSGSASVSVTPSPVPSASPFPPMNTPSATPIPMEIDPPPSSSTAASTAATAMEGTTTNINVKLEPMDISFTSVASTTNTLEARPSSAIPSRSPTPQPPSRQCTPSPTDPDQLLKELLSLQLQLAHQISANRTYRETIVSRLASKDFATYRARQDELHRSVTASYHRAARWQCIRASMTRGLVDVLLPPALLAYHRNKFQYDIDSSQEAYESNATGDIFLDTDDFHAPKPHAKSSVELEHDLMMESHEYNDYSVCSICFGTGPTLSSLAGEDQSVLNSNPLIFCDVCNVCVHLYCYGLPGVPEESTWTCQWCVAHPETKHSRRTTPISAPDPLPPSPPLAPTVVTPPTPSPPMLAPSAAAAATAAAAAAAAAAGMLPNFITSYLLSLQLPLDSTGLAAAFDPSSPASMQIDSPIPSSLLSQQSKANLKKAEQLEKQRKKREAQLEAERLKVESDRRREAAKRAERKRREEEEPLPCCLCTVRGGALKPTDAFDCDIEGYMVYQNRLNQLTSSGGVSGSSKSQTPFPPRRLWAHIVCALWIPRVTIADSSTMQPIHGVADAWKYRFYKHGMPISSAMTALTTKSTPTTHSVAAGFGKNAYAVHTLARVQKCGNEMNVNPFHLMPNPSATPPSSTTSIGGLNGSASSTPANSSTSSSTQADASTFIVALPPLPPHAPQHRAAPADPHGMRGDRAMETVGKIYAMNNAYTAASIISKPTPMLPPTPSQSTYDPAGLWTMVPMLRASSLPTMMPSTAPSASSNDTNEHLTLPRPIPSSLTAPTASDGTVSTARTGPQHSGVCGLCKKAYGCTVYCSADLCSQAYHPLCAWYAGLHMHIDTSAGESADTRYYIYCYMHTPLHVLGIQLNQDESGIKVESNTNTTSHKPTSNPDEPCYFPLVTLDLRPSVSSSIASFLSLFRSRNKLRLLQQREWRNRGRQETTRAKKLARRKRQLRLYGVEPLTRLRVRTNADGTQRLDRSARVDTKIQLKEEVTIGPDGQPTTRVAKEDQYELGRCAVCFHSEEELRAQRNWTEKQEWHEWRERAREATSLGYAVPPQPSATPIPSPDLNSKKKRDVAAGIAQQIPPHITAFYALNPLLRCSECEVEVHAKCYGVQYSEVASMIQAEERRKAKLQRVVKMGMNTGAVNSADITTSSSSSSSSSSSMLSQPFSASSLQNELDELHAQFIDENWEEIEESEGSDVSWRCRRCTDKSGRDIVCALCSRKGGAFKRADNDCWVHVVCALWIPECTFADEYALEPVTGLDEISAARRRLKCYLCRRVGPCIECSDHMCGQAFHPLCGMLAGQLMMEVHDSANSCTYLASCRKHTPLHLSRFHPLPQAYTNLTWMKKCLDNSTTLIVEAQRRAEQELKDLEKQQAADAALFIEKRRLAVFGPLASTFTSTTSTHSNNTPQSSPTNSSSRRTGSRKDLTPTNSMLPTVSSWPEAQFMMAALNSMGMGAGFDFLNKLSGAMPSPTAASGSSSDKSSAAAAAAQAAANANFATLMFGQSLAGMMQQQQQQQNGGYQTPSSRQSSSVPSPSQTTRHTPVVPSTPAAAAAATSSSLNSRGIPAASSTPSSSQPNDDDIPLSSLTGTASTLASSTSAVATSSTPRTSTTTPTPTNAAASSSSSSSSSTTSGLPPTPNSAGRKRRANEEPEEKPTKKQANTNTKSKRGRQEEKESR